MEITAVWAAHGRSVLVRVEYYPGDKPIPSGSLIGGHISGDKGIYLRKGFT